MSMSKETVLDEINKLVFREGCASNPRLCKMDYNKLLDLNVQLVESHMPFDDVVTQRRAIATIRNLENQIRA